MDLWESVIGLAVMAVAMSAVFSFFYCCKRREEKKSLEKVQGGEFVRVRTMGGYNLPFCLAYGIILFAGTVVAVILTALEESIEPNVVVIIFVAGVLLSGFCLFLFLFYKFNYVIANAEEVTVHRLFKKPRTYRYEEISHYKTTHGGLTFYAENGAELFSLSSRVDYGCVVEFFTLSKIKNIENEEEV